MLGLPGPPQLPRKGREGTRLRPIRQGWPKSKLAEVEKAEVEFDFHHNTPPPLNKKQCIINFKLLFHVVIVFHIVKIFHMSQIKIVIVNNFLN